MSTAIDPAIRDVLDGAVIAHLATVDADGAPHNTPVFVGVHDGFVAWFTGPDSRKARNLHRDPRVALSIAPPDAPFAPVVVRGRVVRWVDGDDGWAIVDAIATKYLGGPYPRDAERVVALVEPDHQRVGIG